jgi:hypothetical protein
MNQNSAELAASLEEIGWMNGPETSPGAVGWSLPQAFGNYRIMIAKVKDFNGYLAACLNSWVENERSEYINDMKHE